MRQRAAIVLAVIASAACSGAAFADTTPATTTSPATTDNSTTVPTTTDVSTTAPTTTAATVTEPPTTVMEPPTTVTEPTTTVETTVSTQAATTTLSGTATTTPGRPQARPACAGAGMLLLLVPHEAPRQVGPAVAARTPAGAGATTFDYPSNGSMLRSISPRADVSGCVKGSEPKTATSTVRSLSLFGGAVQAAGVTATLVHASAAGSGWRLRVLVKGLRVEGRRVSLRPNATLEVGRWGRLLLDGVHVGRSSSGLGWLRAGLELRFVKAHAGLPPGTRLYVAYVGANRPFAVIARRAKAPRLKVGAPLTVTPPLRGGPYVFPVGGDVGFSDSYAAARSDVPGGWHHGDDLFSGLGSPVLAVADGVVFSVGWNRVGGWRLWLRDRQGNEFYYAHLSGYTRLAHNGDHVTAGQPLAFVGNTGDAITTPHHLHFEIHPVGLLRLGYDGAVDPTTYLNTWKHLTRVAPLAPVRLPAGAALHGDGALSDYRQLLIARGILPTGRRRGVPSLLTVLGPSLLPELNVTPAVLSAPQLGWQAGVAAALAAFFSVTALLLRFRIRELGRRLRREPSG